MDPLPIAAAALLGVLVGAIVVGVLAWGYTERARNRADPEPPGVGRSGMEILAALDATIVLLDNDDEVLRASPEAYSFGLVRNDQLTARDLRAMVDEARRTGELQERDLTISRSPLQGAGIMRLDTRVALLQQGVVLVLLTDTTAQMRLEETRRDFVANVSHELKTPVGALALLAETVEEYADEPETVRHFASRMRVESTRLTALIRDIIDLTRLQSPDALTPPKPVDIDTVVGEAVDSVRVAASDRNVTVVFGGTPRLRVFGDRSTLAMAVRNLLDNAVRHSHESGRVNVGVSRAEDRVRIAVVDQGEGIAPEHQERVFERFYRADPARSRETGGTGLGLSIVKHVVSDHGGRVELWSALGKGSTFTIILPVADPQAQDAAGEKDASRKGTR